MLHRDGLASGFDCEPPLGDPAYTPTALQRLKGNVAPLGGPTAGRVTDAARRDTDNDGILDPEELDPAQGGGVVTDPTNPDSDGDGIPDGRDGTPADGIVFYHGDHLGSTTVLTNHQGTELARVVYKPFGEAVTAAGGPVPEFGFTGQRFEAGLGIYPVRLAPQPVVDGRPQPGRACSPGRRASRPRAAPAGGARPSHPPPASGQWPGPVRPSSLGKDFDRHHLAIGDPQLR